MYKAKNITIITKKKMEKSPENVTKM